MRKEGPRDPAKLQTFRIRSRGKEGLHEPEPKVRVAKKLQTFRIGSCGKQVDVPERGLLRPRLHATSPGSRSVSNGSECRCRVPRVCARPLPRNSTTS